MKRKTLAKNRSNGAAASKAGRSGGHKRSMKMLIRRAAGRENAEHDRAYLDALQPPPIIIHRGTPNEERIA